MFVMLCHNPILSSHVSHTHMPQLQTDLGIRGLDIIGKFEEEKRRKKILSHIENFKKELAIANSLVPNTESLQQLILHSEISVDWNKTYTVMHV